MRHDPFDYGRDAFEFVEGLDALSSTRQVLDSLQAAVTRYGLETLLFMGLPNPEQRFDDLVVARRWPSEWFQIYAQNSYVHVDPVIRHVRRTAMPFEWSEVRFDPEREPRAAELMQRRRDFGFGGALVVPVPGPAGGMACVSMSAPKLMLTPRDRRPLHLMAYYAFERLTCIRAPRVWSKRPSLTDREREVLTWAAMGKSAWEIGEILSIAERTVNEHAQTTFQKLGAANRTHAVALAMRDRLISV
jgi:LuxR family quorum sensing-dependent transcriptional regulator